MKSLGLFAAIVAGVLLYRISVSPDWQDAIGAAATMLIKPLVVPLVELINVPAFVYCASLTILLAAIAACFAYWFRSARPRLIRLRSVQHDIVSLPLPGPLHRAAQWPDAMRQIGQLLRDREVFISAWAEFQIRASGEYGIPNVPFSHYVASEPQQGERDRTGFMQSLPGYFTSFGLILTFVGLVVALYFAARGFRSGNMLEARNAIVQLLNAASFKFLTSVAALASAMLISIFLRLCLSRIRNESIRTMETVESVISVWRECLSSDKASGRTATQVHNSEHELLERVSILLTAVEQLTKAVENLTSRHEARLNEAEDGHR